MKPNATHISSTHEIVTNCLGLFPKEIRKSNQPNLQRILHDCKLATQLLPANAAICDIGAGHSLFGPIMSKLGFKVTIIDKYSERIKFSQKSSNKNGIEDAKQFLKIVSELGISVYDGSAESFLDEQMKQFDLVSLFHVLEHYHHSPRSTLHKIIKTIRTNGYLLIACPNNVNIRKRLTVPFGFGSWSPLEQWYYQEHFYGHVREPSVSDLLEISHDLQLTNPKIIGQNFYGKRSKFWFARFGAHFADPILRAFPTLCSDIYLFGKR